jgi:hypothetical protein
MEEKLELRMYGLVPYNISPIQQGIQFGHAVVDYGLQHGMTEQYLDWAQNWKTFIILNGGTTNDNPKWLGTLNQHAQTLGEMNIPTSCFYEPDLGDQLTAVVFIVDERVFNKEKYPDPVYQNGLEFEQTNQILQQEFIKSIGGYTNYKLREFLKQFRLA